MAGRRRQVDGDRRGLRRRRRRRAALGAHAPLPARAGGSRAAALAVGFATASHLRWARSCSTRSSTASRRCPTGRTRGDVLRARRARRASTSARSTRSTPAGARRPPTPTSPGWAAPSASSSTTTCSRTSRRDEVAPRRRPRARPRALPRRAARAALRRARGAARRSSPPRCSPGAWRRPSRGPGRRALPALALSSRVVSFGVTVVANQLSRRDRGARRQLLAAPDRRAASPSSASSAASRCATSPTPTRPAGSSRLLATHPPTVERIGDRARPSRPARARARVAAGYSSSLGGGGGPSYSGRLLMPSRVRHLE